MAKRYTKADQIQDLIQAYNEKRRREGKLPVKRSWTGLGHWLNTTEKDQHKICEIFTSDDGFIGFLKGLLVDQL